MTNFQRIVRRREFTVLILILILGAIFSFTTERFLSVSNISNLLLQLSGVAITAIGMTMVIITGGIDVSAGSTLGMACVVSGYLLLGGYSPFLALVLAVLVGLGIGLVNGTIIAWGGIPPIIATLG